MLGLGVGSIYALVALGLVLVYRGSGVVNFSQGALALSGSAFFFEFNDDLPVVVALIMSTALCAILGAAIQLLVMAPLRSASPLARLIATLGLLALGLEIWDRRYDTAIAPEQFLPDAGVHILGVVVPESRLYLFVITTVLGAVCWAVYRFTRFGLATTAVAENERVAAAQGWSPNQIATINWAAGGALAGFAGSMLFGLLGINPTAHVLLVIPALAAALLGGFRSFPGTVGGGLALGVMDSMALRYIDGQGFTQGAQQAIPFLLIIGVLVLRGRALPLRSYAADRLPLLGSGRVSPWMVVGGFVSMVVAGLLFGDSWSTAMYIGSFYGLVVLSLVVLTGFAGQLSLAQFAVAGLGALLAGRVAGDLWGLPTVAAIAVGVSLTVPIGLLISLPALRVRGVNLAIVTLSLAVVVDAMILTNTKYSREGFVPATIPDPQLFGIDLTRAAHPGRYAAFCMVLFTLGALSVANLRRSQLGRQMIAVRGNEQAAASLGISVTTVKTFAFGVASGLAALGGSLVAFANPNLVPETNFPRLANINVVLFAVIGGIGHVGAAIVGGLSVAGGGVERIVAELVDPQGWWALVTAVLLLAVVIARPDGIAAGVVAEFRGAGQHWRQVLLAIAAIWLLVSLVSLHRVWNEDGLRGSNFSEGKVARALLAIAIVGCVVAVRRHNRLLPAAVVASLAGGTVVLLTTLATEELAFDGSWKWAVAGATNAFIAAGYVGLNIWAKKYDGRQPMQKVDHAVEVRRVPPKTLRLEGVTVRFGSVVALDGASMTIDPGRVHGLIGPNGAGKTTLIEASTGFIESSGTVLMGEQDVSTLSATKRARAGVARTFQSLELFEDMSVYDNLRTAGSSTRLRSWLRDLVWPVNQGLTAAAVAAIQEFDLEGILHLPPEQLPYAQRRTVAIARTLAMEPSVILLDEPAAGLDAASTAELELLIRRLADDWGMAVLLIEHDVGLVMRVCDTVTALDFGRVIAEGPARDVAADPAVVAAYLGSSWEDDASTPPPTTETVTQ